MSTRQRPQAVLFTVATIWSATAVPLWVAARQLPVGLGAPGFVAADWHGYEMLFGYALAVVAGFLIGPVSRVTLAALAGAWFLARATALLASFGVIHAAASALFAVQVAALASPKLLRAPSQLQNRVLGPVVLLICADASIAAFDAVHRVKLLLLGLDLYALLLVFMGGRLIAGAAAGQFYRRGQRLDERVQPHVESALIVALLVLAACDLFSAPEAAVATVLTIASGLVLVRWLRWRLWTCFDAWNLSALGAGYLWLGLGFELRASRSLPLWLSANEALHGFTVGALGSLTLLVMGRIRAMTSGVDPERSRPLLAAAVLVNISAVTRLLAGVWPGARSALLFGAAAAWTAAFAILMGFFVSLPRSRQELPRAAPANRDEGTPNT